MQYATQICFGLSDCKYVCQFWSDTVITEKIKPLDNGPEVDIPLKWLISHAVAALYIDL